MPHEVQSQISQYTFQSNIFQPARTNAIYYPNWRARDGQTPATLNFNCINFVYYAFANVNPDGTVTLSDEDVDLRMSVDGTSGCINSLMRLKKQYYYLKVILSIGGANGSQNFSSVASNAAYRDNFARTARGLVEGLGFDGIDIDWESPKDPQEGNNFIALLAAIRTQLPPFRYYVTAALPAGEWALQNIDIYKSQSYLDLINLMAYDFNGSWTTRSGYQSQLFSSKPDENSGDKAVHYLLSKGFPVSKILLGIPVYGRSFLGAAGPGQTYTGLGGNDGAFAYNSLPRPNASENVDRRLVSAYCVGGDGGFISYDNPDTVKLKANYCNAFGLAVRNLLVSNSHQPRYFRPVNYDSCLDNPYNALVVYVQNKYGQSNSTRNIFDEINYEARCIEADKLMKLIHDIYFTDSLSRAFFTGKQPKMQVRDREA